MHDSYYLAKTASFEFSKNCVGFIHSTMSTFLSKVILMTAGYGNIMRATAKAFAKHGAILSISGRNAEKLSRAAAEYKEAGAKEVLTIQADLNMTEDLDRMINETVNKFGKIDILVNCVRASHESTLDTFTPEMFNNSFHLHVTVPALLIRKAAPHLEKTKGNVINVGGSASEIHQLPFQFVSGCSGAAKDKLTKMCALELAPKGIRVNSVNPTYCEYTDNASEETKELRDRQALKQPLGQQLIKFDEIANSILYLASDSANVITGQIVRLDRGRILTGQ